MKLINKTVLAKLLTVFLLMGVLSFYAVPQVDAKSDDIDIETTIQKAKQGDVKVQFNLGFMYNDGQGVPQDYKQATYWFKKSAEQGYAYAQFCLGFMYYHGQGVPQDYKQAIHWYTKSAEQRYADAQFFLGGLYHEGQGVPQDYKQAAYWWKKSAKQGNAKAQICLGGLYHEGQGVLKDYKQAVHWYTKSAEQGVAFAQYNLGNMYYNGQGVPQNYKFAYAWSCLAVAQGYEKAKKNRALSASFLSPQQLIQAQELASKIQYKIDNPSKPQKSDPSIPETEINQVNSTGTGFFVTRNGYILTCHHVIKDAKSIKIVMGETQYTAKLIRDDPHNDLALLKINGSFQAIAFSSKHSAKMGQEVFTIGFPNPNLQGVSAKFTKGTINSLTGFQDDLRLYQISVPVQPGNSGGALLDDKGNVLGVIVAQLDAKITFKISGSLPQSVNYAIKSIYAQAMLDTIPGISGKLLSPSKKQSFENAVNRAKKSTVMVLSYKE